jgi:hypothetical protein
MRSRCCLFIFSFPEIIACLLWEIGSSLLNPPRHHHKALSKPAGNILWQVIPHFGEIRRRSKARRLEIDKRDRQSRLWRPVSEEFSSGAFRDRIFTPPRRQMRRGIGAGAFEMTFWLQPASQLQRSGASGNFLKSFEAMSDNGHETSSPIGFVQISYRSLEVSFFCSSLLLCVLATRWVVLLVNGIVLSAVGMEALQEATDPLPALPDLAKVRT